MFLTTSRPNQSDVIHSLAPDGSQICDADEVQQEADGYMILIDEAAPCDVGPRLANGKIMNGAECSSTHQTGPRPLVDIPRSFTSCALRRRRPNTVGNLIFPPGN